MVALLGLAAYFLNDFSTSSQVDVSSHQSKTDSIKKFRPTFSTIPLETKERCHKMFSQFSEDEKMLDMVGKGVSVRTETSVVYSPVLNSCIGVIRRSERFNSEDNSYSSSAEISQVKDLFTSEILDSYRKDRAETGAEELLNQMRQQEAFETFLYYVSGGQLGRDSSDMLDKELSKMPLTDGLLYPFNKYLSK